MEQINEWISENLTTESTVRDHSIVKLSSLVPDWSTISLIMYIIIAMLLGLPGNSLVLIVITRVKRKTSTDWFVIFIAACDFISLSVNGTLYILFLIPQVWTAISSEFLCKFQYYIIHCVFLQSLLLITCMGLDRYMKTCKLHSVLFTPNRAVKCCYMITIVSFLFNASQFFTTKLNIYGECALDSTKSALRNSVYGFTLVVICLCSGAVCIMYWKIALRIRRRMKVGLSEMTSTGGSMYQNEAIVLSGSRGSCDNVRHLQHIVSYPGGEEGVSARTVTSHKDTRDSSEHVYTINTKRVTLNNKTKQHLNFDVTASTSTKHQGNENRSSWDKVVKKHEDHRSRQINKTSKIMGAITFVFILSTIVPAVALSILSVQEDVKKDPTARVIIFFVTRLYLINNFANPLFYIWLSSEFRKRTMQTLNGCKRRF